MIVDKKSKMVIDNRKQARKLFGEKRYNKYVKSKRLAFITDDNPFLTTMEQIEYYLSL